MLRQNRQIRSVNLQKLITDPEWSKALQPTFKKPYFKEIENFLEKEINIKKKTILPPQKDIFTALNACPMSKVKVVLIGQDPYHDHGQAHGLCFSVLPGIKPPPSLVNIYKELEAEDQELLIGNKTSSKRNEKKLVFTRPNHGYLLPWAKQGVLMLNASLTVELHKANSHSKIGWQEFTDDVIDVLVESRKHGDDPCSSSPLVFLLWGNFAKKKAERIFLLGNNSKNSSGNHQKHIVIETAHPSPLSARKWFGCRCFSKCNRALLDLGQEGIDWRL